MGTTPTAYPQKKAEVSKVDRNAPLAIDEKSEANISVPIVDRDAALKIEGAIEGHSVPTVDKNASLAVDSLGETREEAAVEKFNKKLFIMGILGLVVVCGLVVGFFVFSHSFKADEQKVVTPVELKANNSASDSAVPNLKLAN